MNPGDRVYVNNPLFSDWATVIGFVNDAHFPVMVELENGDTHGHKYTRVSSEEIEEGSDG